jgi:hypothetical protein
MGARRKQLLGQQQVSHGNQGESFSRVCRTIAHSLPCTTPTASRSDVPGCCSSRRHTGRERAQATLKLASEAAIEETVDDEVGGGVEHFQRVADLDDVELELTTARVGIGPA